VALVGRPDQVAAIRRDGLKVDGVMGSTVTHLRVATTLPFRPDLMVLAVKTQDVVSALREHAAAGLPETLVVTAQNGVRSDELAASVVAPFRLVGAVVLMHATYLEPGQVTVLHRGGLVVGRPTGPRDSQVETVAQVLNEALPTLVSDNVAGARWLKLIINLNNALPALANRSVREVYGDAPLARLAVQLMREGLRVVGRAGIALESLPDMPLGLFRDRLPHGEIVRLGQRHGLPTPLNARVVELVHQVERTGTFLTPAEVHAEIEAVTRRPRAVALFNSSSGKPN
jgi:2-dehydropantoate 2-reductase